MATTIFRLKPNSKKKLEITVDGLSYQRYPIKTHVITGKDDLLDIISRYALAYLSSGDTLVLSERMVAITQGRSYPIETIHVSFLAKFLVHFVSKPSWGIGIGNEASMEMAIREVGILKILSGAFIAALTKPFGIKGLFYRVVGNGINAIDGPTSYTLPPYNMCVTLGPKNPDVVANKIQAFVKKHKKSVEVAIIDANDIGVRLEGTTSGVKWDLLCRIFKDNPLGQQKEQTPMAIVRLA